MAKSCALPRSVFPLKFKVRSPVHALQLARELIRPIKHWTQNELAVYKEKDEYGDVDFVGTEADDPRAEAFCALGALQRVNTKHQEAAQKFLVQAAVLVQGEKDVENATEDDIFEVNDSLGHRQTLRMFDRAIKLARDAR